MRISEVAESAGVRTSTVRYYERIGLMSVPARTASGYRDYASDAVARLLLITRARRMGLSCEQIAGLVPVWDGTSCAGSRSQVEKLVDEKQAEIAARIAELRVLSDQLAAVRESLHQQPVPVACRDDLSCCVPDLRGGPVPVELVRH